MANTLITLIIIGFVGYLVTTFIPMVQPVKTIVVAGFAIVAIVVLLRMLPAVGI